MKEIEKLKEELRQAMSDYVRSEGCSCCQDRDKHKESAERIAKLIDVPPYDDGSGYQFIK